MEIRVLTKSTNIDYRVFSTVCENKNHKQISNTDKNVSLERIKFILHRSVCKRNNVYIKQGRVM